MRPTRIPQLLLLACLLLGAAKDSPSVPEYTADGALVLPADYREWVYLSSGLDMSYRKDGGMDHSMFDNVFVDPVAWATFKKTGHWPDRTVFMMEVRVAGSKGSINESGHYQLGELMGLEAHVHDEARFPGGWGFFAFGGKDPAPPIPQTADCYSCHRAHGGLDTTFTQFYPTAKAIAVAAGTYHGD